jgi:Uncharacterized protein conserved in bacteria
MDFHYVPYRSCQRRGWRPWFATLCTLGLLCLLAGVILYAQLTAALVGLAPSAQSSIPSVLRRPSLAQAAQSQPPVQLSPLAVSSHALRAVWIATVANIDWPVHTGLSPAEQQQSFRRQLDAAQALHFNAVIVQVRPVADALYPSQYAPWSQYLTGVQGRDPGYDPLAFMVKEAHRRHIALHAWFNPYRVSLHDDLTALAATNSARQHPEWVVHYGGRLYFDPGIPQVRTLVTQSILEVVQRYPIDGVQLDDYFYPYPVNGQSFPDAVTYQRYGAADFPVLADWRRDNVNRLIQGLYQTIKRLRPGVQFGISPFGVWRNQADDPGGSATHASVTDYDVLYADTRTWIRRHWIDYIAPQLYWSRGYAAADYDVLLPWWVKEVAGSRVRLYIGLSAYNIATWSDPQELRQQLLLNQRYPAVSGSIFFSLKDVLRNAPYFRTLWSIR